MPTDEKGVYRRSIRSGTWYLASVFGQKSVSLVTFFVLARLLLPSDYGVITIVVLLIGLANQLTAFPFGDALLQRKESVETYLDPSWTFDVLRAAFLAILLFIGGGAISGFFHITGPFVLLVRLSGLLILIPALGNVRQIYFFRDLDFFKVFIRDMVAQSAYALVAIGYAVFVDRSAWALFVGYVVQNIAGMAISYVLYPSRPRFSVRLGVLRELIGYSKWVYGQELLDFALSQFDKLFVGRMLQPAELGIYAKSKDLASTATATIGALLGKIGLPAYAKVQDQMEKVRIGFVKSIDVLLITSVPAALFVLLEGGAIVTLLLGPKWLGIVVPLKIFAFGNLFLAFVRAVAPVFGAIGRPDLNFKVNMIQTAFSVPLMVLGFWRYGLNGLAGAIVVTWIILLGYVVLRARKVLQINKHAFYPAISALFAAGGVTLCVDLILRQLFPTETPVMDLLRVGLIVVVYFMTILFQWQWKRNGPWGTLLSILRELGIQNASRAGLG